MVTPSGKDETRQILQISFNQDQKCFSCGTQIGFKVLRSYPYADTFNRNLEGGIGIAEMLFRSNILALVGGGTHPKFPDNKVFIWDDHQNKPIGELTFKSTVLAVRLRKDKLLIAIESKLYLYNLADLKLLNSWDLAIQNTKGLCVLSPTGDSILAYPDGKIGYFYIRNGGI